MAVTAFARGIQQLDHQFDDGPVAASTTCYRRAIVMRDGSGYIKNGATAAGCRGVGVAAMNDGMFGAAGTNPDVWDNASGSAAAFRVKYEKGIWGPFANSSSSIVAGMEGQRCYIVDNVTVHATSGAGTRSPAGIIHEVTAAGVYVDFCEDDVSDDETRVLRAFRQLTTGEVLALHTTPITVSPAPAAGYYIEPINVELFLDYNSVAYAAIAGTDFVLLKQTDGSGATVATSPDPSTFGASTADAYLHFNGATSFVPLNAAIVAFLAGAWTTGNSPIGVTVLYRVRKLAPAV